MRTAPSKVALLRIGKEKRMQINVQNAALERSMSRKKTFAWPARESNALSADDIMFSARRAKTVAISSAISPCAQIARTNVKFAVECYVPVAQRQKDEMKTSLSIITKKTKPI